MKHSRLIILQRLKNGIIDKIHFEHQGISKCRLLAKRAGVWGCQLNRSWTNKNLQVLYTTSARPSLRIGSFRASKTPMADGSESS